jgi:hypothetical protein
MNGNPQLLLNSLEKSSETHHTDLDALAYLILKSGEKWKEAGGVPKEIFELSQVFKYAGTDIDLAKMMDCTLHLQFKTSESLKRKKIKKFNKSKNRMPKVLKDGFTPDAGKCFFTLERWIAKADRANVRGGGDRRQGGAGASSKKKRK